MRELPIERIPCPPDQSREWHPVPCRGCLRVRTMHVAALCAACRPADEAAA